MPNATDQPTDRPKRGTLYILVLAGVIAVGLWYWRTLSENQVEPETPRTAETTSGAAPTADSGTTSAPDTSRAVDSGAETPADVARTADSGTATATQEPETAGSGVATPTGVAGTTDPDTATSEDKTETAGSGTAAPTDIAQATDSDAATPKEKTETAGSGTAAPTDIAQATDSDAATPKEKTETAGSGTAAPTDVAQTTDSGAATAGEEPASTGSGAAAQSGNLQTAGADAETPIDAARSTDSGATGSAQRIAAVEPPAASAGEETVLSSVPESSVERVPVEAPTGTDMAGETGILATVGRAIEQLEAAIQEQLSTEPDTEPKVDPEADPEADPDAELRVRVTYDDAQKDTAGTEVEPKETLQSADSPAAPPPADTRTADSGVEVGTATDESAQSGGTAPSDVTRTAGSGVEVGTATDESAQSGGAPPSDVTRTTDSDATRTADSDATRTADSDATRAADSDVTRTTDSDSAEDEAKNYVETLTETAPQTIPVDKADHFVTQERVVSLVPEDAIESVSVEELAKDETLTSDTPITVVREVEQIEIAVPEQLIAESGGDLDQPLRVQVTYDDSQDETEPGDSRPKAVEAEGVEQITVREALERMVSEPGKPLSVIKTVRYFEVMTLRELLDSEGDGDGFLTVVTQPYRIESATLADLLQRHKAENPDSIFYLRTVLPTDNQGIWGIIHFGLIENFARGMAIRRGEDIETYTVEIPRHADERLGDRSSSFLGKLIDRKTKDSFVYNYRENRMGRNPDRIYPGQELVIINFELEELKAIHKHFASS